MPYDTISVQQYPVNELYELGLAASQEDLDLAVIPDAQLGKHTIRLLDRASTDNWRALRQQGDPDAHENHRQVSKAFVTQMAEGSSRNGLNLRQMMLEAGPQFPRNEGEREMNSLFERAAELQQVNARYNVLHVSTPNTQASHDRKVGFNIGMEL